MREINDAAAGERFLSQQEERLMSYKLIVLIASGQSEDAQVFDAAAKLATLQGGHVRVIPVYPDPAADLVYYGVVMHKASKEAAAARMRESDREVQSGLERLARETAARHGLRYGDGHGLSMSLDQRDLDPALALAEAAVLADLVVIGAHCARDFPNLSALFAQTLLVNRAPVLVVKEGALNFDSAAIAWDGSREAAGAVKAALPILHIAKQILVLQERSELWNTGAAAQPQTVIDYLAQHGLTNAHLKSVRSDDVAAALLSGARDNNCGLLVAGGYGRPRFVELVLGGTTRSLVNADGRPHLLLAH